MTEKQNRFPELGLIALVVPGTAGLMMGKMVQYGIPKIVRTKCTNNT